MYVTTAVHHIQIQEQFKRIKQHLLQLVAHAMSCCETTSDPYMKGEAKSHELFTDNVLGDKLNAFLTPTSIHDQICAVGEVFLFKLYDVSNAYTHTKRRIIMCKRMVASLSLSYIMQSNIHSNKNCLLL